MKSRILIKTLLALSVTVVLRGQEIKINKANQEFDNFSYIDARKIYLDVVKDGYESAQVFKKLGDTYYFNSEYGEAAKWYKKLVEQFPNQVEPEYYYRASQVLKSTGEYEEANKMMENYRASSNQATIAQNFLSIESLKNSEQKSWQVINITNGLSSSDFGPSFYGDKLVYASSSINPEGSKIHDWNGLPYLDLYEANIGQDGRLQDPLPLNGDVNTPYHESSAVFTKDGSTIYFTRNNYINGKKKRTKDRLVSLKIYKAVKNENGSWNNVEELPFNNDSHSTAHPALSPDEKRLYFSSDREGTLGRSDIWYVDILPNGNYSAPVNVGSKINTQERESFPYISDTNDLYFSSDGHPGLGGLDIFVVSLDTNGKYQQVTNLKSPINSNQDDFGFIINKEKLGYLSSNREGIEGSISDDIYLVTENCNIIIKGIVTDAKTDAPLSGAQVTLLDENNNVVAQTTTKVDGSYSFDGMANCGESHSVRATFDENEYEPTEEMLVTPNGSQIVEVHLELTPPDCPVDDLGCRLALQPIYFDFDKHNIRPDAEVELAKILQAMKNYPQLKIHIESHTDSRGNDHYNQKLSERRAKSTMQWLINKGVESSRLSAKGYGESQLINKCANGVDCSKEEHQSNRRSMFLIKN
ncbi:OmpA family protein [Flagellimonas marina]|uniref:OmpA family protein n=1 Tax=Flagellimonas marina TaxID=1775168 RepID=A0ABV8PKB9_9FLAO